MTANRHPADELADIRAELRRLRIREAELREILLADDADLKGDDYCAQIVQQQYRRLSRQRLEHRFGVEAVAECCKQIAAVYVHLVKQ
jgi:hypothetical protein